jgi:hypothetical protein
MGGTNPHWQGQKPGIHTGLSHNVTYADSLSTSAFSVFPHHNFMLILAEFMNDNINILVIVYDTIYLHKDYELYGL